MQARAKPSARAGKLRSEIALMPSHSCSSAPDHRLVGDPVDTLSGAVFDRKLEFRLTGPLELWWYRHYDSSQNQRRFAFGWGHTHDFDRVLRLEENGMVYEAAVGQRLLFPLLLNNGDEDARNGCILRKLSQNRYHLFKNGEPAMEFNFSRSATSARLHRFFQGSDQIIFLYSEDQRLERIVDSRGRNILVTQEADGRIVRLTLEHKNGQPGSLLVAYYYDQRGNLVATKNQSGHGYAFTYDGANRMLMRRGRKGFTFRFEYDQQGRCIMAAGDDNLHGVKLTYTVPRRVTKVRRADQGEWIYIFNAEGALEMIRDPLGGAQKLLRDEAGQVVLEIDANGNPTRIKYDASGSPVAKIDPLGYKTALPEDPNASDPLNHRIAENPAEYEYGRLLKVGAITLPSREQVAGLPLSAEQRLLVSLRGRERDQVSSNEFPARPLGVRWWPEPRAGHVFNDFGKLVEQNDEFGRQRHWTYDPSGNVAEYVDFDGKKWIYDNGSWHFLKAVTDPLGATVRYSYTTNGQVASCVDPGGTISEYRYDANEHLIEVKRCGVARDIYTRDVVGNLVAKHSGNGRELLRIEVGPGNLPIRRVLASGDEQSFRYDKSGRPLEAMTENDRVEFSYDGLGSTLFEKRNDLGVEHQYEGLYNPSQSTYLDRYVVRFERLNSSRLIVVDPTGKSQEIFFHGHGLVERRFSNKSRETSQYDNLGRCLFKCAQLRNDHVWSRSYFWSGEGELQRIKDNTQGEVRHEYDAAHRLRRRTFGAKVETFEMDPAGNLLSQPRLSRATPKSGNRLAAVDGFICSYNDRDLLEECGSTQGPIRFTYDSRDQLIQVDSSKGEWRAEYDAFNRRTRKIWAGQTTEYYWNGDQLVAEVAADGSVRLYIYPDPLSLTPLLFLDYDSLSAPVETGRRYFVFSDQIGTPYLIEDDNGNGVWRASIDPFGHAEVATDAKFEFNLRFPGHYFDPETRLHYNRFRYYDPKLGRYLQSDPWGISGGCNLYAYRPNPLLDVDVRGLGEENIKKGKPCPDEEGTGPVRTSRPATDEEISPVTGEPVKGAATVVEHTVDGKVVARYYLDENGRTIQAEGLLDPPTSYKKEGVSHIKPDGFEDDQDHRGHLIPERSAANQSSVNQPENVIAEHGTESNLSAKKSWENAARKEAEKNPGTTSVHQPEYDGDNPRPTSVTHSLYDKDGNEIPGMTKNIPNPNYK